MIRYFLLISFVAVFSVAFSAPSVKIFSDAYDGKVEVDETFHITIEATDCVNKIDVNSLPPGVKMVYNTTNQTTRSSIINGKSSTTYTTRLIMTCKGQIPGKYTFGPVYIDGLKSNTVSYQVVPSTGKSNRNSKPGTTNSAASPYNPSGGPLFIGKGNEEMYLRANVNKTTAYEQEAIEYTVKLYTTYGDIKFLGAAAAPKFDGFVVEESPDISSSFSFEDIGGTTFKTAVIARYIIFPQKAGKLKISGNTYTVSTDARQYYHDPYFQTITVKQPVQLNVTPNDIIIDVKDLPSPVPSNFIGGVGHFSISSSMPKTELTTNTAATLVYNVEGSGNIKYLKMPDLSAYLPASFEIYTPDVEVNAEVSGSTVTGTSKFDYSFIPREAGDYIVPEIILSYFDPSDGKYKTLQTKSYKVVVGLGQSSSKSQQAMIFNPKLLPVGKVNKEVRTPFVNSGLYWLWYIIPTIIFVASLAIYRRYLNNHDDMVLYRSKNANKMALKRLAKAYRAYQDNNEEEFYNEMLAALWGYLADKLKIPTSVLNRSNVGEEFKSHGVKETTFIPIINLIDECEYAKYTPVSRNSNMKQLYADAVESLSKVESEYDKKTEDHPNDTETDTPSDDNYINTSGEAKENVTK